MTICLVLWLMVAPICGCEGMCGAADFDGVSEES